MKALTLVSLFSLSSVLAIGQTITSQPKAVQQCSGTNVTFTVVASGSNLSYKWEEMSNLTSGEEISNGGVFSGATTSSLTLTGVGEDQHNHYYRCVVTSSQGTVKTEPALLTVLSTPVITRQPQNVSVSTNGTAQYSLDFEPATTSKAQWQESRDNGATWNDIQTPVTYEGANTSELKITEAGSSMNNCRYRCVVSSPCGTSVTSNGVTLGVQ